MDQRGNTAERFRLSESARSRFRPRPTGLCVLLATFGLLAFLPIPASSQATAPGPWVTPASTISTPNVNSREPEIAFRPDGTAIGLWIVGDAGVDRVQAATRPPGGSWSPLQLVSTPGGDAGGPRLAVAPDGAVTAIWRQQDGSIDRVHAATMPAGPVSFFDLPVALSDDARSTDEYALAIGLDGTAAVVWRGYSGLSSSIQGVVREPGGAWGTVEDLTAFPGEQAENPAVTVAPDGAVTAAWSFEVGSGNDIQARTRPPHGTFGSPETIATGFYPSEGAQLVAANDGTTTIAWDYEDGDQYRIYAASRPAGGAFGPAEMISGTDQATGPRMAFAPDGAITIAWMNRTGSGDEYLVRAAHRPAGQANFEVPVTLSAPLSENYPTRRHSVAVAPDGTATVIWARQQNRREEDKFIEVASRPPGAGQTFGPPQDLTGQIEAGEYPTIAYSADGTGIGTAIWEFWDGSNYVVQSVTTETPDLTLGVVKSGTGHGEITSAPAGIDCGSTCAADFPAYTEITLTAAASEGSTFTGWSGEGCAGTGTCQMTMDRARNVTAGFSLNLHQLKVVKDGGGSGRVTSTPDGIECGATCEVNFSHSEIVTLTASADPGSTFTGWSGEGCAGIGSCRVTMDRARNVSASFDTSPEPPPTPQPTNSTAVFDGKRLHVLLKCGSQYKPACNMTAAPVTGKGKTAKPMAKPVKKKIKAGKWVKVSFLITPKYRAGVKAMSKKKSKTLLVQQNIRSKKIGRKKFKGKKPRVVYHRYVVRSAG